MHTHSLDFDLPLNLGKVRATINHRPLDADHILVTVQIDQLPKLFRAFLPPSALSKPHERKIKRTLMREWADKLDLWSDEPATENPEAADA